jgi:hypothetical protein
MAILPFARELNQIMFARAVRLVKGYGPVSTQRVRRTGRYEWEALRLGLRQTTASLLGIRVISPQQMPNS